MNEKKKGKEKESSISQHVYSRSRMIALKQIKIKKVKESHMSAQDDDELFLLSSGQASNDDK